MYVILVSRLATAKAFEKSSAAGNLRPIGDSTFPFPNVLSLTSVCTGRVYDRRKRRSNDLRVSIGYVLIFAFNSSVNGWGGRVTDANISYRPTETDSLVNVVSTFPTRTRPFGGIFAKNGSCDSGKSRSGIERVGRTVDGCQIAATASTNHSDEPVVGEEIPR